MPACHQEHKFLVNGVGKCSKPIMETLWFCEKPAYGNRTEEGRARYDGYMPFLACYEHGGPKETLPPAEQDKVNEANRWRDANRTAAFFEALAETKQR